MSDLESWVRETMHRVEEQMKELSTAVTDVRERLIRMEATTLHNDVATLETKLEAATVRITLLEADRLARNETGKTVGKVAEWAWRLAPWIFVVAFVAYTQFTK